MNQRFAHKQTVRAVSRAHDRHDGLRLHDRRHRHGEIRRRALPTRLQSGEIDSGTNYSLNIQQSVLICNTEVQIKVCMSC